MVGEIMGKNRKPIENTTSTASGKTVAFDKDIRFIVPMPGRSAWHSQHNQLTFKKVHTFSERAGDFALEDYQAQFLMQREYLID